MRKHIEDLYMYVYNNSSKPAAKVTEWRSIVERVEKQLVLRIVSCCQIASKLNSHYEVNSILSFFFKVSILSHGQVHFYNSIAASDKNKF